MRSFAGRLTGGADDYAIVLMEGMVVTVWRAESQSYKAMGKKRFTESKRAVLDYCASLVGVSTNDLERNAERAA
jgi:hypothetical protein